MVFSSPLSLYFFLPIALLLYFSSPQKRKNLLLLLVSLFFYAWGEPVYVVLILFSSVADYVLGLLIGRYRTTKGWVAKLTLIGSFVTSLTLLGFFKYADFLIRSWNELWGTQVELLDLPLPIGISFYTFQTMSCIIDVYRGKVAAQKNFISFAMYVTLFPQLIVRPIVRYEWIEKELANRNVTVAMFADGVKLFCIGLGKKVLLANQLGALWEEVQSTGFSDVSVATAWLGIAATNKHLFQPYVVETKTFTDSKGKDAQVKVGITGIVPPDILKWDKAHLEGEVTVQDSVQAVEWAVQEMKKQGADVVIVLGHSGFGDAVHTVGEEDVAYLLTKVKDVDELVTDHAHSTFPDAKTAPKLPNVDVESGRINGVPTVMPGKYGSHLGVIDLELVKQGNGWKVATSSSEIRAISTDATVVDQAVMDSVKAVHEKTLSYVREAAGTITSDIHSYFTQVADDPSIQIVTDAQKWYMEKNIAQIAAVNPEYANLPILSAGAPFKAGTRSDPEYYTYVPKGEIAIKNLADLYLYDNKLAALVVRGAEVKEWLEMSAGQFKQISATATGEQQLINTDFRSHNFYVIDGVTYDIDVTQPAKYSTDGVVVNDSASRISNLMYDGKHIDPKQKFIVATNNYRANGLFPGVRDKEALIMFPDENRQAIIDYILEKKTIDPSADSNWKFAPLPTSANVVFESSPKPKDAISAGSGISYVGEGTDGFAKYRLTQ